MFKRIHGPRAVVLAVAGFLSILSGVLGYADTVQKFLPAKAQGVLWLVMVVGFACAVLALGTTGDKVDGVLYREYLEQRKTITGLKEQLAKDQPRHLDAQQAATVTLALRAGLDEFARTCRDKGWTSADDGVAVQLTAIGAEREVVNYRDDFKKAFEAAGFFIQLQDCDVNAPDTLPYVGTVTVLTESSNNTVRPFVIEALKSAGVPVREGGFSVPFQMYRTYESGKQVMTRLVFGPRI